MEKIIIIINGKEAQVDKNFTILQAAKSLGIEVPTICNDNRLVPHGACRMCVVEVKNARALLTACTTPVAEGMEINTHSERVINSRKTTLELMIANHPLDCLTCSKAGNCKLQDYCFEYDVTGEKFSGFDKDDLPIDDSNDFYTFDPNKCILCGKCVKVCDELQCTSAIGFSGRGFSTHVSHPFEAGMDYSTCVSCGNCVSVCPVGALMPKEKTKFREWEVKKTQTTCSYCGVGCQIELKVKNNKVVGVDPAMGPSNDGLLCVKGKFGYKFINHPDRLKIPLIKKDGVFNEATWDEAYDLIASKINEIKKEHGSDSIAGLSSARATNEDNYLMQKMMRAVIGTNNIDHCARL